MKRRLKLPQEITPPPDIDGTPLPHEETATDMAPTQGRTAPPGREQARRSSPQVRRPGSEVGAKTKKRKPNRGNQSGQHHNQSSEGSRKPHRKGGNGPGPKAGKSATKKRSGPNRGPKQGGPKASGGRPPQKRSGGRPAQARGARVAGETRVASAAAVRAAPVVPVHHVDVELSTDKPGKAGSLCHLLEHAGGQPECAESRAAGSDMADDMQYRIDMPYISGRTGMARLSSRPPAMRMSATIQTPSSARHPRRPHRRSGTGKVMDDVEGEEQVDVGELPEVVEGALPERQIVEARFGGASGCGSDRGSRDPSRSHWCSEMPAQPSWQRHRHRTRCRQRLPRPGDVRSWPRLSPG